MKEIDLLNNNTIGPFYHFTRRHNLESIEKRGLIPNNGTNSIYYEGEPKIFFSIGNVGFLEICDVWVKWIIYSSEFNKFFIKNPYAKREEFVELFKSEKFYTKEIISDAFEYMYKFMLDNIVLQLDLFENFDYTYDDIDAFKLNENDKELIEKMYTPDSNKDSVYMEKWNMHTIASREIEPNRIYQLVSDNKTNALDIMVDMYYIEKDKGNMNFRFLNEFVDYINKIQNVNESIRRRNYGKTI